MKPIRIFALLLTLILCFLISCGAGDVTSPVGGMEFDEDNPPTTYGNYAKWRFEEDGTVSLYGIYEVVCDYNKETGWIIITEYGKGADTPYFAVNPAKGVVIEGSEEAPVYLIPGGVVQFELQKNDKAVDPYMVIDDAYSFYDMVARTYDQDGRLLEESVLCTFCPAESGPEKFMADYLSARGGSWQYPMHIKYDTQDGLSVPVEDSGITIGWKKNDFWAGSVTTISA